MLGLQGESELDNKVWVVKTHYPERNGRTNFKAKRAIVIVRSPLDCLASLFHMIGSVSHNTSLSERVFERAKEQNLWYEFVMDELKVWNDFHNYWLEKAEEVPTHFITYE